MTSTDLLLQLVPGDELPTLAPELVTRERILDFAGASGDFNPMHVDDVTNVDRGMGGVFAHGMLGTAFVGRVVTDHLGDIPLTSLSIRCTRIVRPGDTLTARGVVESKGLVDGQLHVVFRLEAVNQDDQITHAGTATITIPPVVLPHADDAVLDDSVPLVRWRAIG